jgi:SAM-dependent methyltransferase
MVPRGVLPLARQGRLVRRMDDGVRRVSPSVERNRDPILAVLRGWLGASGLVLEVASGTGEHVVHFARHLPDHVFQPSDPDPGARASIDAWVAEAAVPNVRPAIALDATAEHWPVDATHSPADAVLCINMTHISPWAATVGLVRGAARVLAPGGRLLLYGPYVRSGVETAASNLAFDASLRARDPAWGIRDLEAVASLARDAGFAAPDIVEMPANNLALSFRYRTASR